MKKLFLTVLICLLTLQAQADLNENATIKIDDQASFQYNFVDRPKIGDIILKVRLDRPESREIRVYVEYDMPSMRGHHASGKVEFKRNRAGDYVLPIHFAMGGDWEIILTFEENGAILHQEVLDLDI